MANTYSQLYVHFVFAVKHRQCLIHPNWNNSLYKYITGIIQNHKHKLIAINGMPDHIHILIGLIPSQSMSELMKYVKGSSSKWINDNRLVNGKFEWQSGFGAFSYSSSDVGTVARYIQNQEEHHRISSFREEYVQLLNEFGIVYNEKYIFE